MLSILELIPIQLNLLDITILREIYEIKYNLQLDEL